jgi:prepilin-type N-terminal cleavage/methylation domain-containing protein
VGWSGIVNAAELQAARGRSMRSQTRRGGFTLVELLVVIAIIGILVALLLPAIQAARESGRRTSCSNNLKQIGIALHNYHDTIGVLPFGWSDRGAGWTTMILPFIEQKNVYDTLDFQEGGPGNWDSGSPNQIACETPFSSFICGSAGVPKNVSYNGIARRAPTAYRGVASSVADADDGSASVVGVSMETRYLDGIFFVCSSIKLANILDGTASTFMVGESAFDHRISQDGQGMDFWSIGSPQIDPCTCTGGTGGTEFSEFCGSTGVPIGARFIPATSGHVKELSFSSYHPGGTQFCRADASVQFVPYGINPTVYRAMGSRDGGEPTPDQ